MKFGAARFVRFHFEKGLGGFQRDFADGAGASGIENPVNFWRGHWTSIWQIQSKPRAQAMASRLSSMVLARFWAQAFHGVQRFLKPFLFGFLLPQFFVVSLLVGWFWFGG